MTGTLLDIEDMRYALAGTYLSACVALQIRALRHKKAWTQEELAKRAGLHQNQISALEECTWESRGQPTLETLRKIARAFDVRLRVSFETWSSLVDEFCASPDIHVPLSFYEDPEFTHAPQTQADGPKAHAGGNAADRREETRGEESNSVRRR